MPACTTAPPPGLELPCLGNNYQAWPSDRVETPGLTISTGLAGQTSDPLVSSVPVEFWLELDSTGSVAGIDWSYKPDSANLQRAENFISNWRGLPEASVALQALRPGQHLFVHVSYFLSPYGASASGKVLNVCVHAPDRAKDAVNRERQRVEELTESRERAKRVEEQERKFKEMEAQKELANRRANPEEPPPGKPSEEAKRADRTFLDDIGLHPKVGRGRTLNNITLGERAFNMEGSSRRPHVMQIPVGTLTTATQTELKELTRKGSGGFWGRMAAVAEPYGSLRPANSPAPVGPTPDTVLLCREDDSRILAILFSLRAFQATAMPFENFEKFLTRKYHLDDPQIKRNSWQDKQTGAPTVQWRDATEGWWIEIGGSLPDFVRVCCCRPSPGT